MGLPASDKASFASLHRGIAKEALSYSHYPRIRKIGESQPNRKQCMFGGMKTVFRIGICTPVLEKAGKPDTTASTDRP